MDNRHPNHSNRSGLTAFKASLFFKIIDWCLINTMLFLCITVDTLAYSQSVRAAELPPDSELTQLIQVGSSTQTNVKRITRSDFDFTYTLNISYIGNIPVQQVKGHLISLSPSTQITDADIDFGNLTPGQTLTGKDTYTIRQDRSKPFDPSALKWSRVGRAHAFLVPTRNKFAVVNGGQNRLPTLVLCYEKPQITGK